MSTAPPTGRHREAPAPRAAGFRPEIQGLRAFAVLVVVLEHVVAWPHGGFVGVDVFFVISGFLITGILVREFERSGRISFTGFYRRRIKRILPAATLTLVVTVVAAHLLLQAERARDTLLDALAAFFFVSNWRFADTGTDYFAQGGQPSPLQHFWSLSVEEQFYFVWPWVMLAVLVGVTSGLRRSREAAVRVATAAMVVVVVVSFLFALRESAGAPTEAYFSTLTRVWELGIGALVALTIPLWQRLPGAVRAPLLWAGLAGLVTSIFWISSASQFPAPWAVLPVLSAAAVIVATTGGVPWGTQVLSNRVAGWFGDISYSLYLWHFPVVVLVTAVLPERDVLSVGTVLVGSVVVAAASYYVVERPVMTSPWLTSQVPRRTPGEAPAYDRSTAWSRWREEHRGAAVRWGAIGVVASLVMVGTVGWAASNRSDTAVAAQVRAEQEELDARADRLAVMTPQERAAYEASPESRIELSLIGSLDAGAWPDAMTPPIDDAFDAGMPTEREECGGRSATTDACEWGDAGSEIVVYGDSLGLTLLPTVRAAYGDTHRVKGLTQEACAVTELAVEFGSEEDRTECLQHREDSVDYINRTQPAVVMLIQNYWWGTPNRLASHASGPVAQAEWAKALTDFTARIAPSGAQVVVVSPPAPTEGVQATDCAIASPAECVGTLSDHWGLISAADRSTGLPYVDTIDWFCTPLGRCPLLSGDYLVKRDTIHPSRQYATSPDVVESFLDLTRQYVDGPA